MVTAPLHTDGAATDEDHDSQTHSQTKEAEWRRELYSLYTATVVLPS